MSECVCVCVCVCMCACVRERQRVENALSHSLWQDNQFECKAAFTWKMAAQAETEDRPNSLLHLKKTVTARLLYYARAQAHTCTQTHAQTHSQTTKPILDKVTTPGASVIKLITVI